MEEDSRNFNITFVGDSWVGKTSLIRTYIEKKYDPDFTEEAAGKYGERRYVATVKVDKKEYNLNVLDTCGVDTYKEVRPLSYANTDCFVLCYSINRCSSYENAEALWWPEIQGYSVPIVLVGVEIDKSVCNQNKCVTTSQGLTLCKKMKAYRLVECSADKDIKLEKVFRKAVRAVEKGRNKKKRKCFI